MSASKYVVETDNQGAYDYVTQFFGLDWSNNQKGIVLRREGTIVAAALYVEYNGTNVFVHLAGTSGRRWLNREFLYWGFHYPFIQLGCKRITCWVESDNKDSIRFVEHIGWTREAVLEKAGKNGVDVYIYRMFREDCRYV